MEDERDLLRPEEIRFNVLNECGSFIAVCVHVSHMSGPRCDDPSRADDGERIDELLRALSDRRRRCALYALREAGRAELDEFAVRTAVRVHGRPRDALSEDAVEGLRCQLHHVHLPVLEETGAVEYDSRSGTVFYRDPPEALETFLEYCAERELGD